MSKYPPPVRPLSMSAVWEQVPAYRESPDPRLREGVAVHLEAVFRVLLARLVESRPAQAADFPTTRDQAFRRVGQGVALADFLRAFRVGQMTLWQGVLAAARNDAQAREAALSVVGDVMQLIEVGSTVAAEAYLEAQQRQMADSDRVRRDLLEDLLARRDLSAGPKQTLLRVAGLEPGTTLLVHSAAPVTPVAGEHVLSAAAGRDPRGAVARYGRAGAGATGRDRRRLAGSGAGAGDHRGEPAAGGRRSAAPAGAAGGRDQHRAFRSERGAGGVCRGVCGPGRAGRAARCDRVAGAVQLRLPGAARGRDRAADGPAAAAAVPRGGRCAGRRVDHNAHGVHRLRPERQDGGPAAAHTCQHRVLPVGTDRRAHRVRSAQLHRRAGVADRGSPARLRTERRLLRRLPPDLWLGSGCVPDRCQHSSVDPYRAGGAGRYRAG